MLAKQVNPHQNRVDTAKSLFGILPEDADIEESKAENRQKNLTNQKVGQP